mmetsp:Transcript_17293/g.30479  ORF Transcript_17293/g.30479 Transcript_17293/m.30479 type:complete len:156 (-) Transcript_17293:57-524(-)
MALVFFPPGSWSKRFGPSFFTVRMIGSHPDDSNKYDLYNMEVERGECDANELLQTGDTTCSYVQESIAFRRRYSEFLELRGALERCGYRKALDSVEDETPFPPKTFFNRKASVVKTRVEQLRLWLERLLQRKEIVGTAPVFEFLQLGKLYSRNEA